MEGGEACFAAARHSGIAIEEFGVNSNTQLDKAIKSDFLKAGVFSVPVTLIILTITFGTLVAAGVPLLIGITAVLAALGLVALPSSILPVDDNLPAVVLLIVFLVIGRDPDESPRAGER